MTRLSPSPVKFNNDEETPSKIIEAESENEGFAPERKGRTHTVDKEGYPMYHPANYDILVSNTSKSLGYGKYYDDAMPCDVVMDTAKDIQHPALVTHLKEEQQTSQGLIAFKNTIKGHFNFNKKKGWMYKYIYFR